MLTLTLLRHAKSSWAGPDLDDIERPLSKRGLKAAPKIGQDLRQLGPALDLVLCSTAVRTRATLALVLAELRPPPPKIRYDAAFYHALPERMLDEVNKHGRNAGHIMLVGHNPGLHALALALPGSGEDEDIEDMTRKFPTAALAQIAFDCQHWTNVRTGTGKLVAFITPSRHA